MFGARINHIFAANFRLLAALYGERIRIPKAGNALKQVGGGFVAVFGFCRFHGFNAVFVN